MYKDQAIKIGVNYRGRILDSITRLERAVDIFLSRYFSKSDNTEDELLTLVFSTLRITMENKRGILDALVKRKSIDIAKYYPGIVTDMQKMLSTRKILAHYHQDTSTEALNSKDGTVIFHTMSPDLKTKKISETDIEEFEAKSNLMIKILLTK